MAATNRADASWLKSVHDSRNIGALRPYHCDKCHPNIRPSEGGIPREGDPPAQTVRHITHQKGASGGGKTCHCQHCSYPVSQAVVDTPPATVNATNILRGGLNNSSRRALGEFPESSSGAGTSATVCAKHLACPLLRLALPPFPFDSRGCSDVHTLLYALSRP
eukprot:scaffold2284_cov402-Prasinococcus_capsulatus_cf.AAC.20